MAEYTTSPDDPTRPASEPEADDATATAFTHPIQYGARAADRTEQVDLDQPLPGLLGRIDEGLDHVDAGVVDQDIDRSELTLDPTDGFAHAAGVTHIERDTERAGAELVPQPSGDRFGTRLVEIADRNGVTIGGECRADGLADASGGAGDERDTIGTVGRLRHGGPPQLGDWNA